MSAPQFVEHYFRREYGHLVARLCRRVGAQHLEEVEDAVQSALMAALETWKVAAPPDDPSAWLSRVAYNNLMEQLRRHTRHRRLLEQVPKDCGDAELSTAEDVRDDLLQMLFVCCDRRFPCRRN